MTNLEVALQYSDDILTGRIKSCEYTKKAVERFKRDLDNKLYIYDEESVVKIVTFIEKLNLSDEYSDSTFKLSAWQKLILCSVYGLLNAETRYRKYTTLILDVARKSSKTQFSCALAMWDLLTTKQAQTIMIATSREQLKENTYKKILQYSGQIDTKEKFIKQMYSHLKYDNKKGNISKLLMLASDAKHHDSYNPSFCCLDEVHAIKDGKLINIMKTGMGSRNEPLLVITTTAGTDTSSYYYELRKYLIKVLYQEIIDEKFYGIIYTLDQTDDFKDKSNIIKANPNYGVSVKESFYDEQINKAENFELERAEILTKNFNIWLKSNSNNTWLEEKYIDESLQDIKIEDFEGYDAYVGIDLGSTSDLTSVTFMFVKDDYVYFFNRCFVPEDSLTSNANREYYKEMSSLGYITISEGNVTHYKIILDLLIKQNELTPIQHIYYDRYNSTQFIISATEEGFNCTPFSQTSGSLNKPLKEFERLIKSERIIIENNPVTKWCFNNVVLKINSMSNYSIDKSSRQNKIDIVASMINAFGGWLENPITGTNVW